MDKNVGQMVEWLKVNFQVSSRSCDKLPVEVVRSVFDQKFRQETNKTFGRIVREAFPGVERKRDGGGYIYKGIQWIKRSQEKSENTNQSTTFLVENSTQTNECLKPVYPEPEPEHVDRERVDKITQTSYKSPNDQRAKELKSKVVTLEENSKSLKREINHVQEKNKKLKECLAKRNKVTSAGTSAGTSTVMSGVNLINTEDLLPTESKCIGEGTYGQCNLKRFKRIGNHLVVVKTMKFKRIEEVIKEARALQSLASDRFPFVYGVQLAKIPYSIIMEFIGNYETQTSSTLYQVVAGKDEVYVNMRQQFDKKSFLNLCKDASDGLSHLHKTGILHNDLKTNNVLVNNGRAFIIDLGKACEASCPPTGKKYLTSYFHIAPEVHNGSCVSYESDVYSLGIIFNFVRKFCNIPELREIEKKCTTRSRVMRPKCAFVRAELNDLTLKTQ